MERPVVFFRHWPAERGSCPAGPRVDQQLVRRRWPHLVRFSTTTPARNHECRFLTTAPNLSGLPPLRCAPPAVFYWHEPMDIAWNLSHGILKHKYHKKRRYSMNCDLLLMPRRRYCPAEGNHQRAVAVLPLIDVPGKLAANRGVGGSDEAILKTATPTFSTGSSATSARKAARPTSTSSVPVWVVQR
ncbi:uncharacterized protein LOC119769780 [Culex quinquefasciatus]|uniref:uncharacterized protein LOC119769780 n=1 Tax=Culex quinquefasciatus TaxID=7176 RepID=UPI0018E2CD8D|nr:uncharacterized protein LOC119769780 [Culex quinquefasciatus]